MHQWLEKMNLSSGLGEVQENQEERKPHSYSRSQGVIISAWNFDCTRNKWGVICWRKCMLAEDYWSKLWLKLQGQSITQTSGSGYEENIRKDNYPLYTLQKHQCRYTVQNKWHLQRVTVKNPFPKEHHLSNQVRMHTHSNLSFSFNCSSLLNFKKSLKKGTQRKQCGHCTGYMQTECRISTNCLDKVKFGWKGRKKQVCLRWRWTQLESSVQSMEKVQGILEAH